MTRNPAFLSLVNRVWCTAILIFLAYYVSQVKVKLSLCLNTTPCRCIEGAELQFYTFLTLVQDSGEWSASHPGRFVITAECLIL